MKTLTAAMSILGILGLGAQSPDKPVILKVSGMVCGACVSTVEKAAKKIDGVKAIKVDRPKGTAEVTYDAAKTSPEAIAKIITDKTGFKTEPPKKP